MKIETTRPKAYKIYIIVGVATEAPRLKAWRSKGIIHSRNSGKKLKRLDALKKSVFRYERRAKEARLRMCRYWVDKRQSEMDRSLKHRPKAAMANQKMASPSKRNHGR